MTVRRTARGPATPRSGRSGRLRKTDPSAPGLHRRRRGRGFEYVDADGVRLSDDEVLARIKALRIPPAWTDVWICPWANGHLQAVGTDKAGRRQYLYHEAWRRRRDHEKFERMMAFAETLPTLRRELASAIAQRGLRRERVLACALRLLDRALIRSGGEEYAAEYGSIGLATLQTEHVELSHGGAITLDYVGKAGVEHRQTVVDAEAQRVLRALKAAPHGGELLAYRNGDGAWRDVKPADVNAYLQELIGEGFSAKDFRTWHATVLTAIGLAVSVRVAHSRTARKRAVARALAETAGYLGNTPAVCRASYVDPRVVDRFRDGQTILPALERLEGGIEPWEQRELLESAVLDLLRDQAEPLERTLAKIMLPDSAELRASTSAARPRTVPRR
jgi:DNA topoisomerase I